MSEQEIVSEELQLLREYAVGTNMYFEVAANIQYQHTNPIILEVWKERLKELARENRIIDGKLNRLWKKKTIR